MRMPVIFAGIAMAVLVSGAHAFNNAPADADTVTLRTSCLEDGGAVEIPNCFTTMAAVDNWLRNVRQAGANKPTLVEIGPGTFGAWACGSSNVTFRGAGRDRSIIKGGVAGSTSSYGVQIAAGCTNLNMQDLRVEASATNPLWAVSVVPAGTVTSWTNVEIVGFAYGWVESTTASCPSHNGKHTWFSSRIVSLGGLSVSRAYSAKCDQSWFWGSEITSNVNSSTSTGGFAIIAHDAEIHLYGSNARLLIAEGSAVSGYSGPGGFFLIGADQGSKVHIHGTGLDVEHNGTGTPDMLYADAASHFHANESGFNIHVGGTGKVRRVAGPGRVEAPYLWGDLQAPPLSGSQNGVQTLISNNGADSYVETDCPLSTDCSGGGDFPHLMIYRSQCTLTGPNNGPWFDTVTRACRQ